MMPLSRNEGTTVCKVWHTPCQSCSWERMALSVHSWCHSQYLTLLRGHKWKTVHQSKSDLSPSLVQKLFFKTSSYGSYSEASFLSLLFHMDANGMFNEICLPACRSAERSYHGECRPRVRLPACDSRIHHLPVIYQIWGKFLISFLIYTIRTPILPYTVVMRIERDYTSQLPTIYNVVTIFLFNCIFITCQVDCEEDDSRNILSRYW